MQLMNIFKVKKILKLKNSLTITSKIALGTI